MRKSKNKLTTKLNHTTVGKGKRGGTVGRVGEVNPWDYKEVKLYINKFKNFFKKETTMYKKLKIDDNYKNI